MHTCAPSLSPVWYCVYESATLQKRTLHKVEPSTKLTDNTDDPLIADNMDKIECDDRAAFISEMDAKGVIYNLEDVPL